MTALTDEEKQQMLDDLNEIHNPEEVVDMFGDFPDATYQTKLDRIYFERIKEEVKLLIKFEIIFGDYISRTVTKWINLKTEQNLDFAAIDLRRLGLPKDFKWKDVETYFPKILDHTYEIALVTNKGFQNIYIRKEINVELPIRKAVDKTNEKLKSEQKTIFTAPSPPEDDIPF